jgi:hypothetical protein
MDLDKDDSRFPDMLARCKELMKTSGELKSLDAGSGPA